MRPPHIITTLQNWALVTKEKMASPLVYDPTLPQHRSEHPRDKAFEVNCNAFSSKFTGFSICHPSYHESTMYLATRHAIYSAAPITEATATFMLLPSWNKEWPQFPAHRSTADSRTYVISWAPYHQTNSHMQKYPYGTTYRHPFPNTLGRCTSLLYGILMAENASMLATRTS